MYDLLNK